GEVEQAARPWILSSMDALLDERMVLGMRVIGLRDLRAGRLPHAGVLADVVERGVERADAVRHAGQVGMNGDGHDAARLGALAIEHVELPADHLLELAGGAVRALEGR